MNFYSNYFPSSFLRKKPFISLEAEMREGTMKNKHLARAYFSTSIKGLYILFESQAGTACNHHLHVSF